MKTMQYTVRGIPAEIDQAMRQRALKEGKSLNAVAVEALAKGLDLSAVSHEFHDLDHLAGSWVEDPAFDEAVAEFSKIDENLWQ